MKFTMIFLVTLFLIGCASTPKLCQLENPKATGMQIAFRGEKLDPELLNKCDESIRTLITQGYEEGKRKHCSVSSIEVKGLEDAENAREKDFPESLFQICENLPVLKESYEKQYQKGLDVYCATDRLKKMGFEQGNQGVPLNFPISKYRVCGGEKLAAAQDAFEKGFTEGQEKLCSKEGTEKVAKLRAFDTASHDFPDTLSICLNKFPDAKTLYPNFFKVARRDYEENYCSYQGGLVLGRKDAEEGHDKRSGMPNFCNADVIGEFKDGYLQGWRETKDRICDSHKAYQKGVEDFKKDRPNRYTVPKECPIEYSAKMQRKYRDGFTYAENQTNIVRPNKNISDGEEESYSQSEAEKFCKEKGHSSKICDGVTSKACIEKGFTPAKCKIKTKFLLAVDECLHKGFQPAQCKEVKDIDCIQEGKNPFLCKNAPEKND